ncbi:MAG: hypothetical protein EA402_14465 [Planctomycetota bacterium]|nr:MAG: hypothetical protein EA402_14465 [Planctomycetota bacterium]
MRYTLLPLFFLAPLLANATESTPSEMVNEAAKALRANDIGKLVTAVLGEDNEMRSEWEDARKDADPEDDMMLNMQLSMISNPDMNEMLIMQSRMGASELPAGQELSQTIGFAPMMVMGFTGGNPALAQSPELTFLMGLLPDLQAWVLTANLNDADKAAQSTRLFLEGFQKLGITNAAELRALEFDEVVAKAGELATVVKEVLKVYAIDLDAFLDTVKASSEGDTLTLNFKMLGKDRSLAMPMVEVDGTWLPKTFVAMQEAMMQPAGGGFDDFEGFDDDFDDE